LEVDNSAALLRYRFCSCLWFLHACDVGDERPSLAHERSALARIGVFDRDKGRFEEAKPGFLGIESRLRVVCLFLLRQPKTPRFPCI
jgi:hypothetical protein